MKRYGYLFEQLYDFGHLYRAYRKALKGSGKTAETARFTFHLERELLQLQEELASGRYQPACYRFFYIYEPKKRKISVAPFRDRVVHHAVVAILEPIFDPTFIVDSYATRKGKGTHLAIKRAQDFLRKNRWYYKADIEKYFERIDQSVLLSLIEKKIKDAKFMSVVEKIIRNGGENGKGLPIGNLTSQFFANVYLNPFDHWIKEELKIKHYLRYMDDFVLFDPSRDRLKQIRSEIRNWLADHLGLNLKEKACFLNQRVHGLGFLGTRIFPGIIRIQSANRHRLKRRLKRKAEAFRNGVIEEEEYTMMLNSYFSYLNHFDSLPLRRFLIEAIGPSA